MFAFAYFLVGTSFISLLAVKLSHSQVFFIKKMFSVIFKLNVFNFDNYLYEVNFCDVHCDAVMTSSSH